MKDDFKFIIEIKKTNDGYKDIVSMKGTKLETLGAIEKTIFILNDTKNRILKESQQ